VRNIPLACGLLSLGLLAPALARADVPEGCTTIGSSATIHTCQHASFGPFQDVQAQPHPGFVFSEVSAPHTFYTVALPAEGAGAVLYLPVATGSFAVYLDEKHTFTVLDSAGAEVAVRLEHPVSSCADPDAITWVRVHDLDETETYTFVIGPTEDGMARLVVEFLPSFSDTLFVDGDGDGYGDPEKAVVSWCGEAQGHAAEAGDCDDSSAGVSPAAAETCNGVDEDCSGAIDDGKDLCAGALSGLACVPDGDTAFCGCSSDADCPSGLACDPTGSVCSAPDGAGGASSGGSAGAGGSTGDSGCAVAPGGSAGGALSWLLALAALSIGRHAWEAARARRTRQPSSPSRNLSHEMRRPITAR
jgi:hypothetical protein